MDLPSQALVDALTYLLPGFIAAAIFYNLTPAPRPIPFERIIQALIFTVLVQVLVPAIRWLLLLVGHRGALGTWSDSVQLAWSIGLALGIGLTAAYVSNTDRVHRLLRKTGLTRQTSYASEWYGALSQHQGYVVLHLEGQRRLYGWPEEWPSTPGEGHWVISQADWLTEDGIVEATGVDKIIVQTQDVEMVELMKVKPVQG